MSTHSQTSLRIPSALRAKIDAKAAELSITRSELILEACRMYLNAFSLRKENNGHQSA